MFSGRGAPQGGRQHRDVSNSNSNRDAIRGPEEGVKNRYSWPGRKLRKKLRVHMNRHHLMTHVLKALIQKAFIKSDEYRTGSFLVEPFFISSKITALCSLEKNYKK